MAMALILTTQSAEVLGDTAFTAEELARACGVAASWVQARVEAGVLHDNGSHGSGLPAEWRFSAPMLLRARRVARFEAVFDADPQLAALTSDLVEEVTRLRRRLQNLGYEEI